MRTQICERKEVERIIRMVLDIGALTHGLEVAASTIWIMDKVTDAGTMM